MVVHHRNHPYTLFSFIFNKANNLNLFIFEQRVHLHLKLMYITINQAVYFKKIVFFVRRLSFTQIYESLNFSLHYRKSYCIAYDFLSFRRWNSFPRNISSFVKSFKKSWTTNKVCCCCVFISSFINKNQFSVCVFFLQVLVF